MLSTTASYLAIQNNMPAQLKAAAASPQNKADTAYYLANIGKVTSITQFVNNYRLFSYAMNAFGLSDMTYAKGLMTKILQGGATNPSALANTLGNAAYKAFAQTFDFTGQGPGVTSTTAVTSGVTARYLQQSVNTTAGQTNAGVELALYFTQNASSITNLYGLLADKNMLKVVQTAFGLPTSASQNIDAEENTLSKYVSVADLKNPAKVKQIAERFTAMYDATGQNTSAATSSIAQIFGSSGSSSGISSDLLLSLQGLRLGGA